MNRDDIGPKKKILHFDVEIVLAPLLLVEMPLDPTYCRDAIGSDQFRDDIGPTLYENKIGHKFEQRCKWTRLWVEMTLGPV